jgi:hypothetical protein
MRCSISHTIAAVLLVPIATRIGESLNDPHPRLLIMVRLVIPFDRIEWFTNALGHRLLR